VDALGHADQHAQVPPKIGFGFFKFGVSEIGVELPDGDGTLVLHRPFTIAKMQKLPRRENLAGLPPSAPIHMPEWIHVFPPLQIVLTAPQSPDANPGDPHGDVP
jgi:hypothetical protein